MIKSIYFCLTLLLSFTLVACDSNDEPEQEFPDVDPPRTVAASDFTVTDTGLMVFDFTVGTGIEAQAGDQVRVHYSGWFTNGVLFDSSVLRNQSFSFRLGNGQVIAGWDEGVAGMKVGGDRQLVIPPDLAYGTRGTQGIPPNSTLIFEVELISVNGDSDTGLAP